MCPSSVYSRVNRLCLRLSNVIESLRIKPKVCGGGSKAFVDVRVQLISCLLNYLFFIFGDKFVKLLTNELKKGVRASIHRLSRGILIYIWNKQAISFHLCVPSRDGREINPSWQCWESCPFPGFSLAHK